MTEIFPRTIQRHGTSIVVAIPPELRMYGYELGTEIDIWEEKGRLIISNREESICGHCKGLTVCRCAECAYASGTLIKRPVIIAVKCAVCNGSGKLK